MLRASFWLAPCLHSPPRDLAIPRWARRAMRPIDFCHPCELRLPAPRALPATCRPFRDVGAPQSLGSARLDRGTECFTSLGTLRRIELRHVSIASRPFRCRRGSRAWAFSSHGAGSTEPLTSLSPLPLAARAHAPSCVLVIHAISTGSCELGEVAAWTGWRGSRQGRRDHRLVKDDGS